MVYTQGDLRSLHADGSQLARGSYSPSWRLCTHVSDWNWCGLVNRVTIRVIFTPHSDKPSSAIDGYYYLFVSGHAFAPKTAAVGY